MMSKRLTPMAITLIYGVFASVWILFSDQLVMGLFSDPAQILFASTFKGWLFVAVTSGILYLGLNSLIVNQRVEIKTQAVNIAQQSASKLTLIFIALALIVPLIGVAFVKIQTPQIEHDAYNDLQTISRLKAEQIENWLIERHGDAEELKASASYIPAYISLFKAMQTNKKRKQYWIGFNGYARIMLTTLFCWLIVMIMYY